MIVGIDLGTTNSLIAVFREGVPELIPNVHGEDLTPSVVGLDDDDQVLVGAAARDRLETHPDRTVAAFKRNMGTAWEARLGERRFRAEELSALVLGSLKADAEALLGEPITEAIVTVPAYFNDTQRKATRVAGQLAGLKVDRLLNEPTAAALAYGLHERDAEKSFLVLDLGGGTFDVSILEMFEGVMEVRASSGDNHLGGDDFRDRIVQAFLAEASLEGIDRKHPDGRFLGLLRARAEDAKRRLGVVEAVTLEVAWEDKSISWGLDRRRFAELVDDLIGRLRGPLEQALRDTGARARDFDDVVLVGGATRMGEVRRLAGRILGRIPSSRLDPDRVVALGAAVQAGLKARHEDLQDIVMTDVAPYSLGTEVVSRLPSGGYRAGRFLPIIERNTVVPVSRVERVHTVSDQQEKVTVNAFQGESLRTEENVPLGSMTIAVPPRPAGEVEVDVRFTYDIDGLLEVQATTVQTGEVVKVLIEGNPGAMDEDEIAARLEVLAELKIHPREESRNRAVTARAERIYRTFLGAVRPRVAAALAGFEAILEAQDPREVEVARVALESFLDEIEGVGHD